jgi:hypothetical protein
VTPALEDCSQASLQRLHEIAYRNGWSEIKADARDAVADRHEWQSPRERTDE